jgi:hypothetical protein
VRLTEILRSRLEAASEFPVDPVASLHRHHVLIVVVLGVVVQDRREESELSPERFPDLGLPVPVQVSLELVEPEVDRPRRDLDRTRIGIR